MRGETDENAGNNVEGYEENGCIERGSRTMDEAGEGEGK